MKQVILISSFIIGVTIQGFSATIWENVKDHGADPSGKNSCTIIINSLIDSLSEKGGGTLFFPAGTFLTGPIVMKSNITLYLDAGSLIRFSDDFDEYLPMVQSRWEDVRVKNFKSQIYAYRCNNISIRGDGHLDGNGKKWWDFMEAVVSKKQVNTKWQDIFKKENSELLERNEYIRGKNNFLRPPMVTMYECKNVLIEGVSFSNPPFWTIMPAFSDDITITGITIENPSDSPNTDGIDPSSCRNVHISNCHISVGDDCIVIKSGRDQDGRDAGSPTENITITNCTMLRGHGGVVIGSEMSGSVRRITISNCVFEGTDRGIRIKTMRGRGGVVEDVRVSNITMYNIVHEAILITLRYQETNQEPLSERTPQVRDISISGISVRNAERPLAIYGLQEMDVTRISLSDLQSVTTKGILLENSSDISFHDLRMTLEDGTPLQATDSRRIACDFISISDPVKVMPFAIFSNCKEVRVTNCYQPANNSVVLMEDEKCEGFIVAYNIFPGSTAIFSKKGKNLSSVNNILKK
jgi:polygalacturonase